MKSFVNMEQRKYLEIVAENGNSSAILKSSGGVSYKTKQAFTIQPPIPLTKAPFKYYSTFSKKKKKKERSNPNKHISW